MKRYDPEVPPDPAEWLRLDEQERIRLIEEHHREQRIELPNLKLHAVFHAIVENQIAEQLESSLRGLTRLTAEGLSRHDLGRKSVQIRLERERESDTSRADRGVGV